MNRSPPRGVVQVAAASAAAGQAVLDPAVHARLLAAASANTPLTPGPAAPLPDGLTAREAEVLALIAAGLTNTQIAARFYVTEATTHINDLFSKTGTHDRAQAVSYAYHHHLTHPPAP